MIVGTLALVMALLDHQRTGLGFEFEEIDQLITLRRIDLFIGVYENIRLLRAKLINKI